MFVCMCLRGGGEGMKRYDRGREIMRGSCINDHLILRRNVVLNADESWRAITGNIHRGFIVQINNRQCFYEYSYHYH